MEMTHTYPLQITISLASKLMPKSEDDKFQWCALLKLVDIVRPLSWIANSTSPFIFYCAMKYPLKPQHLHTSYPFHSFLVKILLILSWGQLNKAFETHAETLGKIHEHLFMLKSTQIKYIHLCI